MPEPRIVERIVRLLALAGSPEPHEAATARKMAERLAAEHGIDLGNLAGHIGTRHDAPGASATYDTPYGTVLQSEPVTSMRRFRCWRHILLVGIARTYGATVVRDVEHGTVHVAGSPDAVRAVTYLYACFGEAIDRVARKLARGRGRTFGTGVRNGLAETVVDRHRRARETYLRKLRRRARAGDRNARATLDRLSSARKAVRHYKRRYVGEGPRRNFGVTGAETAYLDGVYAGRRAGRSIPVAARGGEIDPPDRRKLRAGR